MKDENTNFFSSNGVNLEYEVKRSSHRDIIASMEIKNIIMRSNFDIYIYIYAAMFLVLYMRINNKKILYMISLPLYDCRSFCKEQKYQNIRKLKKDQRGNND